MICDLGNPVEKGSSEMVLRFNVDQLDEDAGMVAFVFSVNTSSEQVDPQGDQVIRARVAKRSEVSVTG